MSSSRVLSLGTGSSAVTCAPSAGPTPSTRSSRECVVVLQQASKNSKRQRRLVRSRTTHIRCIHQPVDCAAAASRRVGRRGRCWLAALRCGQRTGVRCSWLALRSDGRPGHPAQHRLCPGEAAQVSQEGARLPAPGDAGARGARVHLHISGPGQLVRLTGRLLAPASLLLAPPLAPCFQPPSNA